MRLIVDMNLSPRWTQHLLNAHIAAIHWSTVGDPRAPDAEIMSYAAANDYVILTNDLDFGAILAVTHGAKPSVVLIRSDNLDTDVIGARVVNALKALEAELRVGALIVIDAAGARMRLLPLSSR